MRKIRCKRCRNMFEFDGLLPECCPRCKRIEDEQFYLVRDLVREFPGITAMEVSNYTGVSFSAIMRHVEAGDLEVVRNKEGFVDGGRVREWIDVKHEVASKAAAQQKKTEADAQEEELEGTPKKSPDRDQRGKSILRFHTEKNE